MLELQPSAVELMDKVLLDLCRQQPEYARRLTFVEGDPACVLAVEFYVESEAEGQARLNGLRSQLAAHGFRGVVVPLLDPAGQANAWSVRKAGLSLLLSQRGDVKPAGFMEDVAVPPEHLADYVRNVQQMFAEYGKQAAFYAHASAGCLHIRPMLNLKTAADIAVMDAMQSQSAGADPAGRRRVQRRARRRPQADPSEPPALWRTGDAGVCRGQAGFRSTEHLQSGQESAGGGVGTG